MELIERYIYAVTHRLPVDIQADVSDELHATIEETLEQKGSRSKKSIEEVLTTLGDPAILASRYSGKSQYVISPQFYPIFIQVLKMVLAIGLPIVVSIGVIIQIAELPATVGEFISGVIGLTAVAGVQMVFWTTLVFFVIERSGVSDRELIKNSGWTPSMLPATTVKREIPISDAIADIIWYAIIAILPFIAPLLIGAHINGTVTPFFDSNIWTIGGPILVALGLVGIAKSILKLKIGRWTKPLAIFNALYALAFSVVLIVAATTASLINPAFLNVMDTHITTSNLSEITNAATWTLGLSIAIFVGIYAYDAINSLYRAYRPQQQSIAKS